MAKSVLRTLTVGLVLALLSVIAVSVTAAVFVHREAVQREREVLRRVTLLVDAQRLATLAERRTSHSRLLLLTGSPAARAIREAARRQSDQTMDRMEAMTVTPEALAQLERLRRLHDDVARAMDGVLRLRSEGVDQAELLARMEADVMPLRAELDTELERHIAFREAQLREEIAAVEEGRQLPFTLLVAVVPSALAVAGLLAWRLVRTLRRTLGLEAALRESEERFRTLADNMSQLAWMADESGSIFWYNRRWYEFTGTTLEQMKGWGWRRVHDPKELPRVEARFRAAIASGEPWEDTFPLRRHDGQLRWHLSRAMPARDSRGRVVRWFGTNTDIEQQRQQAAALQSAVEVRDVFLGVAAHELKTPLTSLGLRLAHLRQSLEGEASPDARERALRSLDVAQSQAQRLMTLVHTLLDVTRLQADEVTLTREDLEVSRLVEDTVEKVRAHAERAGSPLRVELEEGLWVHADAVRLRQVLMNLLSNAMKFGAGRPIAVSTRAHEGSALVTVSDEGIGMDEETRRRLFTRFERGVSDRHYGGLGLGLFVSRQWVEAMGGHILVESEPGRGSTFTVSLPQSTGARSEPESTHSRATDAEEWPHSP